MSFFIGSKGIYRGKKVRLYGQRFWRDRTPRKSPYSISVLGSDGMGVDYVAENKRTGWKKYFSRMAFDGGKRKYWSK